MGLRNYFWHYESNSHFSLIFFKVMINITLINNIWNHFLAFWLRSNINNILKPYFALQWLTSSSEKFSKGMTTLHLGTTPGQISPLVSSPFQEWQAFQQVRCHVTLQTEISTCFKTNGRLMVPWLHDPFNAPTHGIANSKWLPAGADISLLL